jgi:tetratricopeptide (TPR) repeat protein
VARADRRSVRSTKSNAVADARRRERERAALDDTLFFTRLRSHAKWVFVFLALALGLGFVLFGIGAASGTGITDILRGTGGVSNGGVSLSDAREQVAESPDSVEGYRNLATAAQEEGLADEAITALTRLTELTPKDEDALRELAGLHLAQGTRFAQEAQEAQFRASYYTFGSTFSLPLDLGEGKTLPPDPIDEAVATRANQAVSQAYAKAQESFQSAEATYEKLVLVIPNDPNVQLELAQAAQQSGDYPKAITAYEKFLALAPDDPSAEIVKQQIAQLKAAQAPASSG